MIEAVIFDMDGLMIDSEPLWREAQATVFAKVGIHLSEADMIKTTGVKIDEIVERYYADTPWTVVGKEEVLNGIIETVIQLIRSKGETKKGLHEIIQFFSEKDIRLALASSSNYKIIYAGLERMGLKDVFEVIHSAEEEEYGKPHPAVYLGAARKLGLNPEACLALEDSVFGTISAKAAKMKVIAVPEIESPSFSIADLVLQSLSQFNMDHWTKLNTN